MSIHQARRRRKFSQRGRTLSWRGRIAGVRYRRRRDDRPYRNRVTLLSRGETAFFEPLRQAVADQFLIMCKVRLADVVTCSEASWRRGLGAAIAQKHLDFVLCDPRTLRFVMAIELDDRSHDRPERRRRDRFVDQVLAQAGVRLLRFRARSHYCADAIRQRIMQSVHF